MNNTTSSKVNPFDSVKGWDSWLSTPEALAYEEPKTQRKIAFISGVFDGLHKGHLLILSEMRKLAPYTVVSINSDAYAARKGPGRPLNTLEKRRAALYESGLVDEVVAIEDTPIDVIKMLKPDFICVGRADYAPEQVVGYKECQEWGGQVVIIPEDLGVTTTQMVNQLNPT